jgi:hypothetical protein
MECRMNRRQIIPLLSLPLGLAACGGEQATVRFKLIATVEVDGKRVEGSSVMEITFSRVTVSLVGRGGAYKLYGEALVLDLPGKGTVYMLPTYLQPTGSLSEVHDYGVPHSLGIKNSFGGFTDEDFAKLRAIKGHFAYTLSPAPSSELPLFVAFRDERVPRTIYEVKPMEMASYFPGVRFISLDIEITDEPVTDVLKKRLPWLVGPYKKIAFDRDPPGKHRPERDLPVGYKIVYEHFFGNGSW